MFDLIANKEIDSIDLVPEDLRPLYVEKPNGEGVYTHNPAMASVIKAYSGMAGVTTRLRGELANAQKGKVDLSPLQDYGSTPEEIKAKVQETIDAIKAENKQGGKIDVDKARQEIQAEANRQIQAITGERDAMRVSLEQTMIVGEATRAIAAEKGDPELLLPFVQRQMKLVSEDGKYRPVIVDENGNTRLDPSTSADLSPAQLVKSMKADPKYGRLFESEQSQGGGAQPKNPGSGRVQGMPTKANDPAKMSATQKIAAGLEQQGQRRAS